MTDISSTEFESSSFREQAATMRQALVASPVRRNLLLAVAGILVVILATAVGQVLLNRWNQPFYDAIQRRDMAGFLHQLLVFAEIAGALLLLNVSQQWLNQRIRLSLREALTTDLIGEWMKPTRAFRLTHAGAIGVNPDQRMQQDAGHLSDLSTDLGVGLLQASILLASFIGVLWSLSSGFVFHYGEKTIAVPGYMVWAAFIYAGTASWLSWLVGRPLIRLNSERYAREADLRFSMVRVNEHIDAIALERGEPAERRRLEFDLQTLLNAIRGIFRAQINLAWVTDTYGWITVVVPILVASPVYFAGDISFGGLMMAVGAFNQVHSSLRWSVNNIGGIADWRATLMRVADFRMALKDADILHGDEKRLDFAVNDTNVMTFTNLEVRSQDGCTRLADQHVEIHAGEHVLITGDPGVGKTLFFRAIAGLWPWGSGSIGMPAGSPPELLPRSPYFAPAPLRDVLLPVERPDVIDDATVADVLSDVGLEHLASNLDRNMRWDRELSEDEQRLLGFARVVLRKPQWIIIDEALDAFDGTTVRRLLSVLEKRLPQVTVLNIGRGQHNYEYFPRSLSIVKDTKAASLKPARVRAGAIEPPPARVRPTTR